MSKLQTIKRLEKLETSALNVRDLSAEEIHARLEDLIAAERGEPRKFPPLPVSNRVKHLTPEEIKAELEAAARRFPHWFGDD